MAKKSRVVAPRIDTNEWKVIWRVTQPRSGSYDNDMVFFEGTDEARALAMFKMLRKSKYAVRIEQVRCGPLPESYESAIQLMRSASATNHGEPFPEIPGAWVEVANAKQSTH